MTGLMSVALILLISDPMLAQMPPTGAHANSRLTIGLERPSAKLYIRYTHADTAPKSQVFGSGGIKAIEVTDNKTHRIVKNLNDLRGMVTISNGQDALRYVRLKTSYSTRFLFAHPACEVCTFTVSQSIPNFGIAPEVYPGRNSSGYLGVLTAQAARIGGFSGPHVEQNAEGWRISRWLLIEQNSKGRGKLYVQHVEEMIGRDGSYQMRILKTISPPKLPATRWEPARLVL
jgi:hypothetical protein